MRRKIKSPLARGSCGERCDVEYSVGQRACSRRERTREARSAVRSRGPRQERSGEWVQGHLDQEVPGVVFARATIAHGLPEICQQSRSKASEFPVPIRTSTASQQGRYTSRAFRSIARSCGASRSHTACRHEHTGGMEDHDMVWVTCAPMRRAMKVRARAQQA